MSSLLARVVPLVPAWGVDREFDYAVPEPLQAGIEVGSLVRMVFGHRRVRGVVVELEERDDASLEPLTGIVTRAPVAPAPLPDVYRFMAERYCVPIGAALARSVPPRVRVAPDTPPPQAGSSAPSARSLLAGHEGANALLEAIGGGGAGVWCLRPTSTTGSAELIVGLVSSAMAAGGAALVAVPEVRYPSRTVAALEGAFGSVARVDSAAGDQARSRAWLSLADGHPIGVGGRNVVLAPARTLRLIVIEDEGHPSYRDDRSPRFDARTVARKRAELEGCVCVLLSHAPSVPTAGSAVAKRISYVRPTRTAERAARPLVEVIAAPREGSLSVDLQRRMKDVLDSGRAVGVLVPQRGYARAIWCSECRRSLRCRVCEAGMTYDQASATVRCPRCRRSDPAPAVCPSCGASDFRLLGAGSHRLAEQLAKAFPRVPVLRMDPDIAPEAPPPQREGALVYVATYFGTKPVLRPDVSLVGVLDVDHLLRMPEYTAAERAYSVLAEMAAWAGPAAGGGRMVVQTSEPRHHAIQAVVRGDHAFFLDRELEQRRELGYPPFSELIRLSAAGPAADDAVALLSREARAERARVLGPIDAVRNDAPAREVLLKCPDAQAVARRVRAILPTLPKGTTVRVDVDLP